MRGAGGARKVSMQVVFQNLSATRTDAKAAFCAANLGQCAGTPHDV
jgi:hypothetical protein